MTTRVVLVPGLMGSALMDASRSLTEHQKLCTEHWDKMPKIRDYLKNNGNILCGTDSDLIWGRLQFLHWVADLKAWVDEMVKGDGYRDPKTVKRKELTEIEIKMGDDKPPYMYKPYASMLRELERQRAQIYSFAYDWRLSVDANVAKLQQDVLRLWWNNREPAKVKQEDRLLVIGHSLGGLMARMFVEHPSYVGAKLVRHAILVATPNKGSPNAFGYITKTRRFFQDTPAFQFLEYLQNLGRKPKTASDAIELDAFLNSAEILAEHEDHRLVECFSSIIQLLPTYDFVRPLGDTKGKTRQKWAETYKGRRHSHTNKLALDILGEIDGRLLDGRSLDAWLTLNKVTYDLVGATKLKTNVEMEESKKKSGYKMIEKKEGDGTVPSFSSIGWIERDKDLISILKPTRITAKSTDKYDDRKDKDSQKERYKDYRVHAELCRHSQVIQLCTDRFKQPDRNKPPSKSRLIRGDLGQYEAIAREIFLKKKPPYATLSPSRTKVVCYALINGVDEKKMMIDIETEKVDGKLRLKNPPPGVARPANVFEGRLGRVKYRFVELAPVSNTPSGLMFLPVKGEGFLHFFCIIASPWEPCRNPTHAEMQFHHWMESLRGKPDWQEKIDSILLWNESLQGDFRYSPCAKCCDELATQFHPKSCKVRRIHWRTRYVSPPICSNSTTSESLAKMTAAGWQVYGPMPIDPNKWRPISKQGTAPP